MLTTKELVREAEALPVEERALVVDCLLKTLNPPDSDIDKKWVKVAKRRLHEMRSGEVKGIPGEVVFQKVEKRFS